MPDLFDHNAEQLARRHAPLADRMRPRHLDDLVGQDEALSPGGLLRQWAAGTAATSVLLWGPPGSGKTTIARLLSTGKDRRFVAISAVTSGVAELKRILADAQSLLKLEQRRTVLFIDEIHRFNRAQQDALLHGVEDGTLLLVGATTENPSFEVNSALLSRMQVVRLAALDVDALSQVLRRALGDRERGLGKQGLQVTAEAEALLIRGSAGDARALLNALELCAQHCADTGQTELTAKAAQRATGRRRVLYDKSGEAHYNLISALIKSMRRSDPDAALYYLARMLEGGEDPKFVARRLVVFASEDVGNAQPQALSLTIAVKDAVTFVGLPEAKFALAQCAIYLALAPKSRAAGDAYQRARAAVEAHGAPEVPEHLKNAPQGADSPATAAKAPESNLPPQIAGKRFYEPDT